MASVLQDRSKIRAVVCDLSASPYLDLAGARILHALHDELAAQGIALQVVGARGRVRDLLRADGLAEKVGGLTRTVSLDDAISAARRRVAETYKLVFCTVLALSRRGASALHTSAIGPAAGGASISFGIKKAAGRASDPHFRAPNGFGDPERLPQN